MKSLKENLEKRILPVHRELGKIISIVVSLLFMAPHYAFAGTNYGQNFGQYALDQLFWVAVVIAALALIGCYLKRNFVGVISTIIIGAIVIGFMADPTGVKTVGQDLWSTIKG